LKALHTPATQNEVIRGRAGRQPRRQPVTDAARSHGQSFVLTATPSTSSARESKSSSKPRRRARPAAVSRNTSFVSPGKTPDKRRRRKSWGWSADRGPVHKAGRHNGHIAVRGVVATLSPQVNPPAPGMIQFVDHGAALPVTAGPSSRFAAFSARVGPGCAAAGRHPPFSFGPRQGSGHSTVWASRDLLAREIVPRPDVWPGPPAPHHHPASRSAPIKPWCCSRGPREGAAHGRRADAVFGAGVRHRPRRPPTLRTHYDDALPGPTRAGIATGLPVDSPRGSVPGKGRPHSIDPNTPRLQLDLAQHLSHGDGAVA